MSKIFFRKVCKKGVAKKLVGALLLTMSLSVVGCGSSGSTESENTETTESNETTENSENTEEKATAEESENVMYRVSEVGEDSITVNEMNFGRGRGERPEGEMPEGERPEGMPEGTPGEMPDGERVEGGRPEGEMPDGERPEGMPEGTPGEEMTEEMKEKMQDIRICLLSKGNTILSILQKRY